MFSLLVPKGFCNRDLHGPSDRRCFVQQVCRLFEKAAIICAPPCSLFSPACSSLHMRSFWRPEGNPTVFLVRLSQRILHNFVPCQFLEVWVLLCLSMFIHVHCMHGYLYLPYIYPYMSKCGSIFEATLLRLVVSAMPAVSVIIEQPSGSWCFRQWFMEILIEDLSLLLGNHGYRMVGAR